MSPPKTAGQFRCCSTRERVAYSCGLMTGGGTVTALPADRIERSSAIEVIAAEQREQRITSELSDGDLFGRIDKQQIVVLRGIFVADELLALRRLVQAWGKSVPPFPAGQSASRPHINFHRVDDGSQPTSIPHIAHVYGFGNYGSLPKALQDRMIEVSSLLLDLQNRIAGTQFHLFSGEIKTMVIRHPAGGGYLANHVHPFLPQRVSLFLNLSLPGIDYRQGGPRFRMKGE